MDPQSQAKAIWDALDKMAATDPEEYKKFIQEQMKAAGPQFFASMMQETVNKSKGVSSSRGSDNLMSSFAQMSLKNKKSKIDDRKVNDKTFTSTRKEAVKQSQTATKSNANSPMKESGDSACKNESLSDESFAAASAQSLIGSIVVGVRYSS